MSETDGNQPPWPKFPEQNADGIDLSLIRLSLDLSPTERIRRANEAQRGIMRVRSITRRVIQE